MLKMRCALQVEPICSDVYVDLCIKHIIQQRYLHNWHGRYILIVQGYRDQTFVTNCVIIKVMKSNSIPLYWTYYKIHSMASVLPEKISL